MAQARQAERQESQDSLGGRPRRLAGPARALIARLNLSLSARSIETICSVDISGNTNTSGVQFTSMGVDLYTLSMACRDRDALADRYAAAEESYRKAIKHFKDLKGVAFQQAWDASVDLLQARERAGQLLADHDRVHNCAAASTHSEGS